MEKYTPSSVRLKKVVSCEHKKNTFRRKKYNTPNFIASHNSSDHDCFKMLRKKGNNNVIVLYN